MTNLADFILLGCLYEPFEREGYDKIVASQHVVFVQRFKFWRDRRIDPRQPAKWVDSVLCTFTRANTTAR